MKKILIVDDDTEFRTHLNEVLIENGYDTEVAASGKEALAKSEVREFDVMLLDFMMPKMSGIDVLLEVRKRRPRTRVIMITAFATVENAVDAIRKGASDYISKPLKINELLMTVRRVLEEARFEEGVQRLELDQTLSSMANPIRRNILKLLLAAGPVRLMEITRSLDIEDHTKVVFHLKILKEAEIIEQNDSKAYALTQEGVKTLACLKTIEQLLLG